MIIEFKDLTYSVVEDDRIYNVTIVKQGEPGEAIEVSILPNPDATSPDSAECKPENDNIINSSIIAYSCIYNYSSI